jgi:hypothetical protein
LRGRVRVRARVQLRTSTEDIRNTSYTNYIPLNPPGEGEGGESRLEGEGQCQGEGQGQGEGARMMDAASSPKFEFQQSFTRKVRRYSSSWENSTARWRSVDCTWHSIGRTIRHLIDRVVA